ncbi:unnamed protein product, partial [Amoebophrya sp. A120]
IQSQLLLLLRRLCTLIARIMVQILRAVLFLRTENRSHCQLTLGAFLVEQEAGENQDSQIERTLENPSGWMTSPFSLHVIDLEYISVCSFVNKSHAKNDYLQLVKIFFYVLHRLASPILRRLLQGVGEEKFVESQQLLCLSGKSDIVREMFVKSLTSPERGRSAPPAARDKNPTGSGTTGATATTPSTTSEEDNFFPEDHDEPEYVVAAFFKKRV